MFIQITQCFPLNSLHPLLHHEGGPDGGFALGPQHLHHRRVRLVGLGREGNGVPRQALRPVHRSAHQRVRGGHHGAQDAHGSVVGGLDHQIDEAGDHLDPFERGVLDVIEDVRQAESGMGGQAQDRLGSVSGATGGDLGVEGVAEDGICQLGLEVPFPLGSFHDFGVLEEPSQRAGRLLLRELGSLKGIVLGIVPAEGAVLDDPRRVVVVAVGVVSHQERKELPGQQEMRQVVRLHLLVESVLGEIVGKRQDPRVVAQAEQTLGAPRPDGVGGPPDGGEILQVAIDGHKVAGRNRRAELLERGFRPLRRAVQEEDGSPVLASGPGGGKSRPGRRSWNRIGGRFELRCEPRMIHYSHDFFHPVRVCEIDRFLLLFCFLKHYSTQALTCDDKHFPGDIRKPSFESRIFALEEVFDYTFDNAHLSVLL